ncbi:MAG TPA: helix-turn-helix domain-containing protein [Caproicibacter sp.]|nr:helix-turn-helix domain-containing protein [Caproicibacter sp.]
MIKLNERLREIRVKSGYTQCQVSKILNIDRSTYAYYETGKTRPDVDTLIALTKIFNISLDELLADESSPHGVAEHEYSDNYIHGKKNSSHIYELSVNEKELVAAFRACKLEQQSQFLSDLIKAARENSHLRHSN